MATSPKKLDRFDACLKISVTARQTLLLFGLDAIKIFSEFKTWLALAIRRL